MMPLDTEARARLIAMMDQLEPGLDRSEVVAFANENWRACFDELGAHPGFDQVRAAVLRMVPDLSHGDEQRADLLKSARLALEHFTEAVQAADRTLLLSRHPAWVGIAALELGDLEGTDTLDWAVQLAKQGFELSGVKADEGEVLWAMAEQADESGWSSRAAALLEATVDAPFHDADQGARARLLAAQARLQRGESADTLLEAVAKGSESDHQPRVQAAFTLAHLARERGDKTSAKRWLVDAMAEPAVADEPQVLAHLQAFLADLEAR